MKFIQHATMFVAVTFICCLAQAQETEISHRDVPPVVLAAFEKVYASAKVLEWEKEIYNGKLYYEAETVDGKVPRNILYSPDGTVAQIVEKIAPGDLPSAVTEGVKRQYPNATIRGSQKITYADATEYGLSLSGSKQKKVMMSADGTVASAEGKTAIERNQ
jgi:hypothetical protein